MQWVSYLAYAQSLAFDPPATPIDSATASVTGYVLGFGPLGIIALALAWVLFKNWRLISPAREAAIRAEARADLLAERDRLLAEKREAEEQRDNALTVARDQLAPLLSNFVATTSALVPLLQEIVLSRETPGRRRRGGPDP